MRHMCFGNPIKEYILDIHATLLMLEEYFNKYVGIIVCDDGALFLRGRPDPLAVSSKSERDKLIKMGLGSLVPWYPVRCLSLVEDMFYYYQYRTTKHIDLFMNNPLTESGGVYSISTGCSESAIVRAYLPDIELDEYYNISSLINDMFNAYIFDILRDNPDNVYMLMVKDNGYRLIQYEDIRIIRFNEALENKL